MRIRSLLFSIALVVFFGGLVFADEPEDIPQVPAEDNSSDYVLVTPSEKFNEEFKALDNAIRATTYTVNDLYLLTYDIFYNTAGSSPVNEIVTIRQRVNTINTGVITINTNLTNLLDAINPDYATTGLSLYDMMRSTYSSLFDVDPNDGSISMFEYLLYIYTELEDANTSLNSIISHLATVESYVDGVEGYLNQIKSSNASILSTDQQIYGTLGSVSGNIYTIALIAEKFNDVYLSDDIVQAKEDQQDYEDAAIEDFTGSGSAAATGQDLGNLKDVSTTIKSGLQTGGSVSNGLSAFSTNSGFWDWFTQSNYNNINQPSSGGNNNRSVPDFYADLNNRRSSAPDVIDFYSGNQNQLQDLFEDPRR